MLRRRTLTLESQKDRFAPAAIDLSAAHPDLPAQAALPHGLRQMGIGIYSGGDVLRSEDGLDLPTCPAAEADTGHGTHVAGTIGSDPGGGQQNYLINVTADAPHPEPGGVTDGEASPDAASGYIKVKKLNSGG